MSTRAAAWPNIDAESRGFVATAWDTGLWRSPYLPLFLGQRISIASLASNESRSIFLGWGRKPSGLRAWRRALASGLPCWLLEDGFLRSCGIGSEEPPLSIVVDDRGIYYDASTTSRLELLIAAPHTELQKARAEGLIRSWRTARVSKYNYARELPAVERKRLCDSTPTGSYVLVADQTLGDASIKYGLAYASSFHRMLEAALTENPACTVVLKVHPEVMAGRKKGHFDLVALARNPRIRILGQDVHPVALIEHAQAVYVVTSQIGFEGLLWGKRVRTFGMPFYAGWGLTEDEMSSPERRHPVPLENLVHAALVEYPRYIDPETGERCEPERLIEWMGLQRRMRERFAAEIYAPGFSNWKKPIVQAFFQGSNVKFENPPNQASDEAMLVVWGRRDHAYSHTETIPNGKRRHVIRLEDGFLRSVGLGADLIRPLSWVLDARGIYYDATQPSDLEHILQNADFDASLLQRARILRERVVAAGLTKYNVGNVRWQRQQATLQSVSFSTNEKAPPTRVILVPGQVESDASLAYGAPDICKNLDLLRAVRQANPDAYILYKPHPDVVAGLRRRGQHEHEVAHWCDEVVAEVSMGELLPQIDEVHTLTSLAGFEALLRGKRVVCYGQPFYAGWGLTQDMSPPARRTRKLSLDALVAGALILYPTYVSRTTGKFTTPERALDELLAWRAKSPSIVPWWRKCLRPILGLLNG